MPGAASCTNIYCSRKAGGTAATIYTCIYYVLSSQERSKKEAAAARISAQAHTGIQQNVSKHNRKYRVTRNTFSTKGDTFSLCLVLFLFLFPVLFNILFI